MPTYTYACEACGHRFEAVHSMSAPALSGCPACSGSLRRIIGAVGVAFKGSGFYRTDSRAAARSSEAPAKPAKPATPVTPATPAKPAAPSS